MSQLKLISFSVLGNSESARFYCKANNYVTKKFAFNIPVLHQQKNLDAVIMLMQLFIYILKFYIFIYFSQHTLLE